MNTTAQIEKKIYIKKLFYLGEIFMISFNKIYFFKGFKFVRKMQSSQTRRGGVPVGLAPSRFVWKN